MKIIAVLLLFLTSFISNTSFSTVYYFSNNGDDSNNGVSPVYPLRSVSRINDIIYQMKPGDIILLERGSIFYGQINIGTSGNDKFPVTIGAYGTGQDPVISGSVPVHDWSISKGSIYKANVNGIVKNLLVNENQMTLARFPNSGYLTIDKSFSDHKKGFTDKDLKQYENYWKGSNARIRTINWAYEFSPVQNFKNSSLTLSNPTVYPIHSGWGYYLDNNLSELDTVNEWYFAKSKNENGVVYFFPPNGTRIDDMNIKASIYEYGIYSYKEISNVVIRDLEIRDQSISGIYFAKSRSGIKVINCTFKNIIQTGILIPNKMNILSISDCRFFNINGKAMYLSGVNNSDISGNVIKNIGLIPGYGTTGDAYPMSGIYILGNSNIISGNYIDSIGHDAINCLGTGNTVEKNIIKNCLLYLNDGGAIKCYGDYSKNSVWKNNFILNVPGNTENTNDNNIVALGIYLDEFSNNMSILNNTIIKSGFSGIGINDGFNNVFQNNTCYDNITGINFFQNKNGKGNWVFKNVITGKSDRQFSADIKYLGSDRLPGKFDSNYYFIPGNSKPFKVTMENVESDYNFDEWKEFIRSDLHSRLITGNEIYFSNLYTNMSDDSLKIILNSGYEFKDVNFNYVNGSVVLRPWSSVILFANTDITGLPELNINGGPLNFGEVREGNQSGAGWYNITGKNLREAVTINCPEGFEIGFNYDSGFRTSLTLIPENGKVDKLIFVRFIPDREKNFYDYISNKSSGTESVLKVTGKSK